MRQLLESGAHFGHQSHRWNPKMAPYIYGARNSIHIIDLAQTVPLLHQALKVVSDTVAKGGRVLFVGTKRQAADEVAAAAQRSAQYFVNSRWLGGMLTNWKTISASISRLRKLDEMLAEGAKVVAEGAGAAGLRGLIVERRQFRRRRRRFLFQEGEQASFGGRQRTAAREMRDHPLRLAGIDRHIGFEREVVRVVDQAFAILDLPIDGFQHVADLLRRGRVHHGGEKAEEAVGGTVEFPLDRQGFLAARRAEHRRAGAELEQQSRRAH